VVRIRLAEQIEVFNDVRRQPGEPYIKTHKCLAVLAQVSAPRLCEHNAGKREPTLTTLLRYRDALRCSLDDLVDDSSPNLPTLP
jgi:hypothetical protein